MGQSTERDGTVRVLEAIQYVSEARYNLISIGVLYKKGCRIQLQKNVTVSQRDRIILKGEKCEELYKLKKENSVRGGVSGISLEGSSSRGEALRKTATGHEPGQSVARRSAFGQGPRWPNHDSKSAKGPEESGQELKTSRHGCSQG